MKPAPAQESAGTNGRVRDDKNVTAQEQEKPTGRYKSGIEEMLPLKTKDFNSEFAQKAFEEGEKLRSQLTAESLRKAIGKYKEALQFRRNANDRSGEATALFYIGFVLQRLGERREALDFFEQALQITQQIPENNPSVGMATLLHSIGSMHRDFGDMEKAIDYSNWALQIQRAADAPDRKGEAYMLTGLGKTYCKLGEHQKALKCYDQALQIERNIKDRFGEARTLTCAGEALWSLGDMQKALDYFNRALGLQIEIEKSEETGTSNERAITLNNMGMVYDSLGKKLKALDCCRQALELFQIVGNQRDEACALNNIGSIYYGLGEKQKALEYFDRALPLRRDAGDPSGEAETLFGIAQVERDNGELIEAHTQIEIALDIIESLRAKVAVQELRASYFAAIQNLYEFYIDLLMQLHQQNPSAGYDALAVQAGEHARARCLHELLNEARIDIRQGIAAELLEAERSLQQQLNDKADYQLLLRNRIPLQGRISIAEQKEDIKREMEAAKKEIEKLTEELQKVEAKIRKDSPGYAAIRYPETLNLAEIQKQALDDDTLLLEYALGEERSYLWAVTTTSIFSYELPRRAEIEIAALRVYKLLAEHSRHATNETHKQMQARAAKADADYLKAAAALSQMILGPAAAQLEKKRLAVVSDGALQYIPFSALPRPTIDKARSVPGARKLGKANDSSARIDDNLLIDNHEIVSLPSASTLADLRRGLIGRSLAPKIVAGVLDPVYEATDLRVKTGVQAEQKSTGEQPASRDMPLAQLFLARALDEAGLVNAGQLIPRLPYSQQEAAAIEELVPKRLRKLSLGFDANYANATSPELGDYRIIHFATHGLIDSKHPELSGLLLSLVDEQGQPQKNVMLRLGDIYNMKLSAELVVLSACQTALGKEIRGEGLVGLTRGFMYAGAARVAASLWKVDDEATAELMKRFYKGMLVAKLRPAEALRQAQIDMLHHTRWNSPYYWGAFILQGDWK